MKLPEFDDETHDFDMGLMRKEVENTKCSKTSQVIFAVVPRKRAQHNFVSHLDSIFTILCLVYSNITSSFVR